MAGGEDGAAAEPEMIPVVGSASTPSGYESGSGIEGLDAIAEPVRARLTEGRWCSSSCNRSMRQVAGVVGGG